MTTRVNGGGGVVATFYVSHDLNQAMIDGGIRDDFARRAKQIKAYMDYDIKAAAEQKQA